METHPAGEGAGLEKRVNRVGGGMADVPEDVI
jgi:hypothetical protein